MFLTFFNTEALHHFRRYKSSETISFELLFWRTWNVKCIKGVHYICVVVQVTVSTRSSKSNKQYVWEGVSDTSSYVIREENDPENFIPRGTSITLHLKVCKYLMVLCRQKGFPLSQWDFLPGVGPLWFPISCFPDKNNNFLPLVVYAWR